MSATLNKTKADLDQLEPVKTSETDIQNGEIREPDAAADQGLREMGYEAELSRNRSTLQVAFMSFVLASVPYGLATSLYYPLVNGGPAVMVWGWAVVATVIITVAASLGEITSVYPTAGGVYYQTFMLSPARWRRLAAWICGWSYVAGNIIITLAVNFGSTLFISACVNVLGSESEPAIFEPDTGQVYLIFLAITLLCNFVAALGNRWLSWLDTFAVFWTLAGLFSILTCCLAIAREGRRSAGWALGQLDPQSGWPPGWAFCVGLLHAGYATSSTGMVISMCEEVRQPTIQVPRAMVGTVVLNLIAGLLFLVPLAFVLPDPAKLIQLAQPTPAIIKSAIGNPGGTFALLIPLAVLSLLCGIACTTAASRCTWAFARDGAIPGSKWWKVVNQRLDVPLNALLLSAGIQVTLGLLNFGSAAAFNAFSGAGVVMLTISYGTPVAVSLFDRRSHLQMAPFNLGYLGVACNVVTLAWTYLAVPLFCMPAALPVSADTTNYASAVLGGFCAVAVGWYWVWGRQHYRGPPAGRSFVREEIAISARI